MEEAGVSESQMKIVQDFKVELHYEVIHHLDKVQRSKIVTYFLAELDPATEIKLSHEHQDFKWLSLIDAVALCGFEDMAKAFRSCHEKINQLN